MRHPSFQNQIPFKCLGQYGIGLKKEWAIRKGVGPVLYVEKGTRTAKLIGKLFDELIFTKRDILKVIDEAHDFLFAFLGHVKGYKGSMIHNGKHEEEIIFYNEKEWRFIPEKIEGSTELISKSDFLDEKKKSAFEKKIHESCTLDFAIDDINYIILSRESELDSFIIELEHIFPELEIKEKHRLISKITSAERIMKDS